MGNLENSSIWSKDQLMSKVIVGISTAVTLLVVVLMNIPALKIELPFDPHILPAFHACLNGSVTILLLLSWYFISKKNVIAHQRCNITALVLSATFLVSYVIYHSVAESTSFGGEGLIRYFYYFILLTHIVLAAIILPIILFTFLRAFQGDVSKHRKIAKWTMPLWLYVSSTGVIVYLLISPYYT